jgi:hypothetical protein
MSAANPRVYDYIMFQKLIFVEGNSVHVRIGDKNIMPCCKYFRKQELIFLLLLSYLVVMYDVHDISYLPNLLVHH